MPRVELDELFDAEFLSALTHLRVIARRVARGGRFAEQRSQDSGSGIEFKDYRPYSPGDDLRAIDWNIYRRLGRVFLRMFEELEDLPVYLLPDTSRSMYMETPPRARPALQAALAFASIALNQHDRVGLFPIGADMEIALRPQSGRGRLLRFAESMAQLEASGATNFDQSLRRFHSLGLREGLAIIVSDFFDPGGTQQIVSAVKQLRHRVLFVQIYRATDRNPAIEGDVQLVDCESGDTRDATVTPAVLAQVAAAHDAFQAELTNFASQRGVGLLRLDADREVLPQLATLFEQGSLRV